MNNDNRPHLVRALETTRDLLCAFRRDQPDRYQPYVDHALKEGLVVLEVEKNSYAFSDNFFSWQDIPSRKRGLLIEKAPWMLKLLKDTVREVECYCCTEGIASPEPCLPCRIKEFLDKADNAPDPTL